MSSFIFRVSSIICKISSVIQNFFFVLLCCSKLYVIVSIAVPMLFNCSSQLTLGNDLISLFKRTLTCSFIGNYFFPQILLFNFFHFFRLQLRLQGNYGLKLLGSTIISESLVHHCVVYLISFYVSIISLQVFSKYRVVYLEVLNTYLLLLILPFCN